MDTFLTKHSSLITASLSCFDRLIFKGYLPLVSCPSNSLT